LSLTHLRSVSLSNCVTLQNVGTCWTDVFREQLVTHQ